ncbi:hypothetical protein V6R21_25495 [Limibacter armeniacum]|uniref:hypothetical protein n=1 Tax=Limibacter armeniacum TaxID=466084 RepID=UPI002FE549C0
MMTTKRLILLMASLFALASCSQKQEEGGEQTEVQTAAASLAPAMEEKLSTAMIAEIEKQYESGVAEIKSFEVHEENGVLQLKATALLEDGREVEYKVNKDKETVTEDGTQVEETESTDPEAEVTEEETSEPTEGETEETPQQETEAKE